MNNDDVAVQIYPYNHTVYIIVDNQVLRVRVSLFNQFLNTYTLSLNNHTLTDINQTPIQFPVNAIYATQDEAQQVLNAQLDAAAAAAQERLDTTIEFDASEKAMPLNKQDYNELNTSYISVNENKKGGRRTIKKRSKKTKKSKKSKKNKKSRRRI